MTEIHSPHPGPSVEDGCSHDPGSLIAYQVVNGRIYASGHIVTEIGHLDMTSHRMVWTAALQGEPEQLSHMAAWQQMIDVATIELQRLQEPPW